MRTFTDRPTAGIATDCTDVLRSDRCESGYHGVYRAYRRPNGRTWWIAKVKRGGTSHELPGCRSMNPRECARALVRWYATEFGPSWPAVLAARKVNPFSIRKSLRHGGYVAAVWVCGSREEVCVLARRRRDRWVPTDRLAVFASAGEARRGLRRYLVLRWGLLAPFICYRSGPVVGALARAA